ncbi:MAG: cobalamin B12-binding domain-containing protein [Pseudomonadota bacterium]
MVSEGKGPDPFDLDLYGDAHDDIVQLTGRLSHRTIRLLAEEVVVRLSTRVAPREPDLPVPSQDEINLLARALVADDRDAWTEVLAIPEAVGASVRQIYLEYLGAAAKRLGEWWNSDRMTFAEVTIGVGRIYAIMRSLRPDHEVWSANHRSAFFTAVPGETHTLGVSMAADIFRQRGWEIKLKVGLDHDRIVREVAEGDWTLVGISASSSRFITDLVRLIVALRVTQPLTKVLVSGAIVNQQPNIVGVTGADFATMDIDEAIRDLEQA